MNTIHSADPCKDLIGKSIRRIPPTPRTPDERYYTGGERELAREPISRPSDPPRSPDCGARAWRRRRPRLAVPSNDHKRQHGRGARAAAR